MARKLQLRRLLIMAVLLAAAFAGLGYRLVDLQVLRHEELSEKAHYNTQLQTLLEPRRGDIIDIKGNLLATSIFVKTVAADPTLTESHAQEFAHALSPLLQVPEAQLIPKLSHLVRENAQGETNAVRSVVLKRKVAPETWQKIRDTLQHLNFGLDEKKLSKTDRSNLLALRTKGVFTEAIDGQLRVYPNQSLAAHVLGYVGMQDGATIAGREGIERSLDTKLRGVRGWRITERDSHQREVVPLREQDVGARDGLNVVLTIDSYLQQILESGLAAGMRTNQPISISGIIVRPKTGEVLAMATLPTFDPNNPGGSGADARRNRVIADIAEPGSTFKIVVISGALNENVVNLSEMFDCENGSFYFAGRTLHDHDRHGQLSVKEIITHSSNIGAAKVGIKMGENRLYSYIKNFGFGESTGLPLPGELAGIVHPLKRWSKVSIAQIPMGQGIAVTRMQMTMAMCAIANSGVLMRPMLVDRLEDSDHHVLAKYSPQSVRRIISEQAAKQMVTALKTVVTPEGTAVKAKLDHYTVAGKTGTAQKIENQHYSHDKFFSSFIGFFPADNPELCISITMDEPKGSHYGGLTAGPVFKEVAEQAANYLNIKPEDNSELPGLPTPALSKDGGSIKTAAVTPKMNE